MQPNRITLSFEIANQDAVDLPALINVFHSWIQEDKLPGLNIDVADYKHVPNGPGIVLVGHEIDYSVNNLEGVFTLMADQKRLLEGGLAERIATTFSKLIASSEALEASTALKVDLSKVSITIADRLAAPFGDETYAAIEGPVTETLKSLLQADAVEVAEKQADTRKAPGFVLSVTGGADLATLVAANATSA